MISGIVLRKVDFEETSVIITLINEEEYKSLIIKGAKRKNSDKLALTEPLSIIDYIQSKNSKLPTLIEGNVVNSFRGIKKDLDKLSISSVIIEYIYLLRETINKTKRFYDLLKNTLIELEKTDNNELLLFKFELILLNYLGSSLRKEYINDNYDKTGNISSSIEKIINGEDIDNKSSMRKFFIDYYERELGIKLKSKKIYLEIV